MRFLRAGEPVEFPHGGYQDGDTRGDDVDIAGKVMLVNNQVKVNMGGRTRVLCELRNESERVAAFLTYFGINLSEEEVNAIEGWDMALLS